MSKIKFLMPFLALLVLIAQPVYANIPEKDKINMLLEAIEKSDVKFIRNGEEWEPAKARKHLEEKLAKAGDKVKTADDFISILASKSSTTGKPYHIKTSDNKTVESSIWLKDKLNEINAAKDY